MTSLLAELLFSHLLLAEKSEKPTAMTPHPVLAVDKTEIKGRDKEDGEVPASREEDGGSRDSMGLKPLAVTHVYRGDLLTR